MTMTKISSKNTWYAYGHGLLMFEQDSCSKGHRGTSKKFRALQEVQFSIVLLYLEGRRPSVKSFPSLSRA